MIKMYMMIGLPASGKSTVAKEIARKENAVIISTDELRQELLNDANSQDNNNLIFQEAEKRLKANVEAGNNVIFDATNINYKRRRDWLNRFNRYNVKKIGVLVATPYEECLERNAKRKRKVLEEVIKRMYFNFYIPQYYEGFDDIQVKYNSDYMFGFEDLEDIKQDNPNHSLTVLEHCKKVEELLGDANKEIRIAGRLHDIGKLKTKTFTNKKGETTEIAHFYDHEKVSAYDSLFYCNVVTRLQVFDFSKFMTSQGLYILNLIQWHMILHFKMSEKTINKYRNMLGEAVWKDLEILHKADCEAR